MWRGEAYARATGQAVKSDEDLAFAIEQGQGEVEAKGPSVRETDEVSLVQELRSALGRLEGAKEGLGRVSAGSRFEDEWTDVDVAAA